MYRYQKRKMYGTMTVLNAENDRKILYEMWRTTRNVCDKCGKWSEMIILNVDADENGVYNSCI